MRRFRLLAELENETLGHGSSTVIGTSPRTRMQGKHGYEHALVVGVVSQKGSDTYLRWQGGSGAEHWLVKVAISAPRERHMRRGSQSPWSRSSLATDAASRLSHPLGCTAYQ